ncbi:MULTISPECIES: hypothetical protein [Actinoalloteichus]|uniref:Uncharacterized protein n=1 Tax=Actinoalloteichus fjordicus TaxID=1612552 RepID=A0AAC9PT71_9PSEU|nr:MULTISPECIES: hypothetical protein [Actinoalloteichus]APU15833.1 hypothetical protein UA74_19025 [Actinoalloteichus fjordicus]APU21893.1 hypothetical protein UA75_19515 [Actinoalloteichus sp. GBA129-24]
MTPVEKMHTWAIERKTTASVTVSHRAEAILVELYVQRHALDGLSAFRTQHDLRPDLYRHDESETEIFEAKSTATHDKVREAIAQLCDYAVHSPHPVTRLTALFPERPQPAGMAYLHRMGIDCVFLDEADLFQRTPAPAVRRAHMQPVWRGE